MIIRLIILYLLYLSFVFINKKSKEYYKQPLLNKIQIAFISMTFCLGTAYLKFSQIGTKTTILTNILLIAIPVLWVISIFLTFKKEKIIIGILSSIYMIIITIFGSITIYNLVTFIIPGLPIILPLVGVCWFLLDIRRKKSD